MKFEEFPQFAIKIDSKIFLAGPEIDLINEIDASKLRLNDTHDENFLARGPFKINSQYVSSYERQMWLFAKYKIKNTASEKIHN